MTLAEINTICTRIGKNTRMIVLGDCAQNDLTKKKGDESGFPMFLQIIDNMKEFEKIRFQRCDIIRSGFCKSWIEAYEDWMNNL